ncbi:F-box protein CPR1-like [Mercurialis annua]|uniref:F-box protein CPR1-like n=1 Tax=Mercurialis annua TaxID=3986 RepID=UPI002160D5FF|nr:F-box protein CPR1-like [Mercurialis annua]
MNSAVTDIPVDVISCILSYLPVKSVVRFKCVSKSWHSLISDPFFRKLHLLRSHKSANLVFVLQNPVKHYSYCDATFFDDTISEDSTQIELPFRRQLRLWDGVILCSCDGLLLVRDLYEQLILLNPSTREHRVLPKVENYYSDSVSEGYDLGYDSSSDDYKLLLRRLGRNPEKRNKTTKDPMILSLKTNCWRKVEDLNYDRDIKNAINLNGFLHWLVLHNSSAPGKIVCFSFANETSTEMEHPRNYDNYGLLNLGVLQGCLCLTETKHAAHSTTVWIMKEFGVTSSWMKLITIPQRPGNHAMNLTIPLPLNHMNRTVFLIDDISRNPVDHMLIVNDTEAQDYRFVKIANVQKYKFLTGLTFSRSLMSPNSI